jgi:flagella basal body P-ring formation protein FlgA
MVEQTIHPRKQIGAQTLSTLEEAIGLEATRTIRAGTPITVSDLTAADLVRKGENVTLTVSRGALTISVDTIAMEDGKMGEQVTLTNAESGKVIRGIVTGRHQAKGISP